MHVHVTYEKHEAKFWLEPNIELAHNHGLKPKQIKRARRLIENIKMKSKLGGKSTSEVEVTQFRKVESGY